MIMVAPACAAFLPRARHLLRFVAAPRHPIPLYSPARSCLPARLLLRCSSLLASIKIRAAAPPLGASASIYAAAGSGVSATAASGGSGAASATTDTAAGTGTSSGLDALHYYLVNDTACVEEARQAFNINGFFIRGIESMARVSEGSGRRVAPAVGRR